FCDRLSALRESSGLEIALVAHAGDGNMHPSVFFDAGDEAATATAQEVLEEIMRIGIELGGTITGEHGVGYLKRAWLPNELDEGSRRIQMAVKNALDPLGNLNPGKMLAQVCGFCPRGLGPSRLCPRELGPEGSALGPALPPGAHERDLLAVDPDFLDQVAAQALDRSRFAGDPGIERAVVLLRGSRTALGGLGQRGRHVPEDLLVDVDIL